MTTVRQVFKAHKYEPWITSNPIFKKVKTIKKIFPAIGLSNFEEEVFIDTSSSRLAAAKTLIAEIKSVIQYEHNYIYDHNRQVVLSSMLAALAIADKCVVDNGKTSIKLPIDILSYDNKVAFKSGQSLIAVYNKLQTSSSNRYLHNLEQSEKFKAFSSSNIPSAKHKIVFSSDGPDGIWDIATMSMRGIKSCQAWEHKSNNAKRLVGSMIDPFTGIIYVVSNSKGNAYGSKMLRRCVVRYVVSPATNTVAEKQYLLIEKMYPTLDTATLEAFKELLAEKSGLEVRYNEALDGSYIPTNKHVKKLLPNETSYRDSGIEYSNVASINAFTSEMDTWLTTATYNVIISSMEKCLGNITTPHKIGVDLIRNYIVNRCRILFGYTNYSYGLTTRNAMKTRLNAFSRSRFQTPITATIKQMCRDYYCKTWLDTPTLRALSKSITDGLKFAAKEKADSIVAGAKTKNKPSVYSAFL